ncbi:MAG: hypothetical protein GY696_35695 [Gammaproteobacteria bacterium]|nr:hypothetical protein [Gammaproteobacteria bacterium]
MLIFGVPSRGVAVAGEVTHIGKARGKSKPKKTPPSPKDQGDRRPAFAIRSGYGHEAVAFGCEQLSRHPDVYERGGWLATVTGTDTASDDDKIHRDKGSAVVRMISKGVLWSILMELVLWLKLDSLSKKYKPCDPKQPLVASIHEYGQWPGIKHLRGLTSTPILHQDGSIRTSYGFDKETGYFLSYKGPAIRIPDKLSREDARVAVNNIIEVVRDFPWQSDVDRCGWIALLLTVICRPILPTSPAFAVDANSPAAGKGLAVDAASVLATGNRMAVTPFVAKDDELRKRLLASLISGDIALTIDNCPNGGQIGWNSLNAFVTSATWEDRELGYSRNIKLSNGIVIVLTGNNISVKEDFARRTVHVRLEANSEDPESRDASEFLHPDLLGWISENRAQLLTAALAIPAAYIRAGMPDQGIGRLGSFDQWSRLVCGSLAWVGQPNILALVASKKQERDPSASAHTTLLSIAADMKEFTSKNMLTASEANSETGCALRECLEELCRLQKGILTVRAIGDMLSKWKGRVRRITDGRSVKLAQVPKSEKSKKSSRWTVVDVPGGSRGSGGASGAGSPRDARDINTTPTHRAETGVQETPLDPPTPPGIPWDDSLEWGNDA